MRHRFDAVAALLLLAAGAPLLAQDPKNPDKPDEQASESARDKALRLLNEGKFDEAIRILEDGARVREGSQASGRPSRHAWRRIRGKWRGGPSGPCGAALPAIKPPYPPDRQGIRPPRNRAAPFL